MLNLDFKIEILMRISSMITRLNSRLSYSSLGKTNDHEYIIIRINKVNSKALIFFYFLDCLHDLFTTSNNFFA